MLKNIVKTGEVIMVRNKNIYGRLALSGELYDSARVVDPLEKKAIVFDNCGYVSQQSTCFKFWNKLTSCDNCISMRAYLNKDTYVKIEYNRGKALLVTAAPIVHDGRIFVTETMKDISKNSEYFSCNRNKQKVLKNIINELNDKITKDSLTGVYKKSLINERLLVDINQSCNEGKPLSIIMADIDGFGKINDNYGTALGDKVLRDFSQLITKLIQKNGDWIGRYDGEKFIISLKRTEGETAYKITEKIRNLTEKTTFSYGNVNINITSSFGVYSIKNNRMNINEIISKTDKNLNIAKIRGRNRVIYDK